MDKDCDDCHYYDKNGTCKCSCSLTCRNYDRWVPKEEIINNEKQLEKNETKLPYLQKVLTTKYNLAVDKNADYGNSFDKIMDKLVDHNIDPLQGLYIRLVDKFNRFETLLFSDTQKVKNESIRDTLRDLSNYVDLYMAWEAKNQYIARKYGVGHE